MSPAETTGRPSSVNAAAPAAASSAISLSSSPRWPLLIAAMKPVGTTASVARALDERAEHGGGVDDRVGVRHREDRAVAAGGGGLGARAERLLVLAARRAQVDVRVDERGRDHEATRAGAGSIAADRRRPSTVMRRHSSMPCAGATTRPSSVERVAAAVAAEEHHATSAATRAGDRRDGEQVVEDGHAHDEAGAHLVGDERGVGVGDARVDLDAAVHRARVHDDLARPHALGRDPVERRVLAERRHERLAGRHPLALHAQDVDDVGVRPRPRCRSRPRSRAPRCRAAAASAAPISVERAPTSAERLDERARDARVQRRRRRSRRAAPRAGRAPPRIAYRSSSACVGCWCFPSPAFTTCASV